MLFVFILAHCLLGDGEEGSRKQKEGIAHLKCPTSIGFARYYYSYY